MSKLLKISGILIVLVTLLALSGVVQGQTNYPLTNCRDGAFSTEEDFMMTEREPYDGNPYISDGDLLSPSGQVCARNADLLVNFNPDGIAPADLGLDAVDILNITDRLVAFSTELDDPYGKFTAGDLLFTNGGIIPNAALVQRFGITHDIGLDAVHFIGQADNIQAFADITVQLDREAWLKGRLQDELQRYQIDIWFSIEGTQWSVAAAPILDGDLLSASGGIVVPQANLLPNSVPAGLPQRGVDFGLDAVTARRLYDDVKASDIYFSTEILFRGTPKFNDGDVLGIGNGVVIPNETLIKAFGPKADFLGLDAFWAPVEPTNPPVDPNIQTMCGDRPVVDFDGGIVPIGGSGSGLYKNNLAVSPPGDPPARPCGAYVPIDGYLPATGVKQFRVAYRPSGSSVPAVGTASGIRTNWRLYEWHGWPINACLRTDNLDTDANGWMNTSDYLSAKDGTLTGCTNSGLRLAMWDSANNLGFGPGDPDGHYVLWLEWEDMGGVLHRESVEHHLQLDNTTPVINDLELRYTDANGTVHPVPPCGGASAGVHTFQVYADFADKYYWGYKLRVGGGNPPALAYYGWHNYYDGTAPVANTDDTGTTPDSTLVYLRDIEMTDLGASFVDCCYYLDLWVRDAAIRHSFNGSVAYDVSGSGAWWDNKFLTFAASP